MKSVSVVFRAILLIASVCGLCRVGGRVLAQSPNVLVILTDDQGWGDLSIHGNSNLSTPAIDSIAMQGARFDRFYVSPVCSPTRAEFLTGRYHARGGVYSTSAGGERLNLDESTIADSFLTAGYRTGAFGKWHNGMQYPYHPNGRGFEEFYGFCSGHWGDYFSPPLEHNGQLTKGQGFCADDFTTQAIRFMRESVQQGAPFFAYVPFNTPHSPMQVPDAYWDRFKDKPLGLRNRNADRENVQHTRCALAMCENIDRNVARMLETLDELAIEENTIVIYFCDNGPNGWRWNAGMKGRKGSTDEGGVRSPLLVRWPGQIAAGSVVNEIAAAIDLFPTLTDLCSIPNLNNNPFDGRSLKPLLQGRTEAWQDRFLVSHWRNRVSVRNQRFRMDDRGALFDIGEDPGQDVDVSDQHPDVVQAMSRVSADYLRQVEGYEQDQRPFPLGHQDYLYTQVPARDAQFTGGIERSNRFPNCSFLRNWRSVEDTISWDVTVGKKGTYRVELQYACPKEDLGAKLMLRCGESQLPFEIEVAHDPPLRGGENDRVARVESYVKDFATRTIGTFELEEGPQTLQLQAMSIPGSQAMEFRLLMFTRLD